MSHHTQYSIFYKSERSVRKQKQNETKATAAMFQESHFE